MRVNKKLIYNFDNLFRQYIHGTDTFGKICSKYNNHIKNFDHIAFRAVSHENILRTAEEPINLVLQNTFFYFNKYNADAIWYKTNDKFNRIFMSYYKGVDDDINLTTEEKQLANNMIYSDKITYSDYMTIHNKNQYLAWTLIHGNRINHVALRVPNIKKLTEKLIEDGFKMNTTNGNIYNIGLNGKLIQASLVADKIIHTFADGEYSVPGSFVEFVERIDDVDGFDNDNANNIATSTN